MAGTKRRIGRIAALAGLVVAAGAAAFAAFAYAPALDPVETDRAAFDPALVARGEALSAIGNCGVCHTAEGGRPYAGGYAMRTPFGVVHATNITPEPRTGIGLWSFEAFARAMREGIDREGRHLYPAFPYHYFARASDADLEALYAYAMTRKPVVAEDEPNALAFPLGFRPLIAGWKLLFHRDRDFAADPALAEDENRGLYLVDALGHCGACHTPANPLGAPRRAAALSGGEVDGWIAPALDGSGDKPIAWSRAALERYLASGRHPDHGAAGGPMRPVVASLRAAEPSDVAAIAAYLARLSGAPAEIGVALEPARAYPARRAHLASEVVRGAPMGAERGHADGALLHAGLCASCHHRPAEAILDWPRLETATSLRLSRPDNLIRVILRGLGGPEEAPDRFMPGYAGLADAQVAALVAHLRGSIAGLPPWDDVEGAVAEIRAALAEEEEEG